MLSIGAIFAFLIVSVVHAQNSTELSPIVACARENASTTAPSSMACLPHDVHEPLDTWDPLRYVDEVPTSSCLLRLNKDIAHFNSQLHPGLYISPDKDDITKIHALVVGMPDEVNAGGFFLFFLKVPPDYPLRPPRVRVLTTDGGRVSFNVGLCASGKVRLSILGTRDGPEWSPAADSIETVLLSLQSLMREQPFDEEYGPLDELAFKMKRYDDYIRHETIRVAVCGQVEDALQEADGCPSALRPAMLNIFVAAYLWYEHMVKTRLYQTGSTLEGPMGETVRCEYKQLLSRIRLLMRQAKRKVRAVLTSGAT